MNHAYTELKISIKSFRSDIQLPTQRKPTWVLTKEEWILFPFLKLTREQTLYKTGISSIQRPMYDDLEDNKERFWGIFLSLSEWNLYLTMSFLVTVTVEGSIG